jgi:exopolysaccharide biosynthesis operon protein EpsL
MNSSCLARPAPLVLALMAAFCATAHADELDTLQFKVGETVQHDSNIFRLSDAAPLPVSRSQRADTLAVTNVGVKFNKAYSLQRFELEAEASNYHYSKFSDLNFTAANYAAAWRWAATPKVHGNLTTSRREYVDYTVDVQQQGKVNHRTDTASLADAEYELGASWRVVGGVFDRRTRNSEPLAFVPQTTVRGAEAGFRYVFREGESLSYRYRTGHGDFYNPSSVLSSSPIRDREHEFRADFLPTATTNVQARMSHFNREHTNVPSRDFSGWQGEVNAGWAVTGKTTLAGGFVKELNSYQTNVDNYYDGYRVFVAPVYKPSIKTAVKLRYDYGVRNFKGAPTGFVPSGRSDRIQLASLAFEYEPIRALSLAAGVQRDKRTSNVQFADYKSNSVFASALFRF